MADDLTDSNRLDLSRPRSTVEVVTTTLALYRTYPLLVVLLALAIVAPYELIVLAFSGHPLSGQHNVAAEVALTALDFTLVTALISALYVNAVATIGRGERPKFGDVMVVSVPALPSVAATSIMATLGVVAGLVVLIVPGVVLALRWAVAAQVAAIERAGWLPALRRSRALAAGNYLQPGNYLHIVGVLIFIGAAVVGIDAVATAVAPGSDASAPSVALDIAIRALTRPLGALAAAILYYDLRARYSESVTDPRKEGFIERLF